MPDLNLSDARGRDAVVSGESVRPSKQIYYVDDEKSYASSVRILQGTTEHNLDGLKEKVGGDDLQKIGEALIEGDPEVDVESFGSYLTELSRVYVDKEGEVVYRIEQHEIVRDPSGQEKERRPRERLEGNVDSEVPLAWTGKMMKKDEAIRRFVFSGKLQVAHVNGLTYDFLFKMAKELHEKDSLLLLGAGPKGKDPLVFRRGSVPYRGFLGGRVKGDQYLLLLHLSNQELKAPEPLPEKEAEPKKEPATAPKPKAKAAPKKKAPTKKKAAAKKAPAKKTAKKSTEKKAPAKKSATKKKAAKKKT